MKQAIKSGALAGFVALAMVIFSSTSYAANVGNLNFSGSSTVGGSVSASGVCSSGGTVNYTLTNANGLTNMGSGTANSSGNFTTLLNIPSTYTVGNSSLTATCPNGDTLGIALNIAPPQSNLITFNTPARTISGTVNASGVCGPTTSGAVNGNPVTFTLTRGGVATAIYASSDTNIGTANTTGAITTGTNGAFNATLALPTNTGSGLGTLTATCSNGQTVSSLAVLGDPNISTGLVLGANTGSNTPINNNSNTNSSLMNNTSIGRVAGVSTVPVGGVRAGEGGTADSGSISLFFLLTGIVAMAVIFAGKQMQQSNF
ncbi:MAG: hypothetical protein NVSMB66_4330 [Candidatus Doudnabacteria bacterium]